MASAQHLGRDEVLRRGLAGLAVGDDLIRDFLTLVEAVHAGALDGADVHEHILASIIRLDETKAFLAIEPLHGSLSHLRFLLSI